MVGIIAFILIAGLGIFFSINKNITPSKLISSKKKLPTLPRDDSFQISSIPFDYNTCINGPSIIYLPALSKNKSEGICFAWTSISPSYNLYIITR